MLVGIIGGGQLGMYLAQACQKLGHQALVLEPNSQCSAARYAKIIAKNYEDKAGLDELARCDVITYEFENIKFSAIDYLLAKNANVIQKTKPLKISQHRFIEKSEIKKADLKTADFKLITKLTDLDDIKFPYILKTCTSGYDGKGQYRIRSKEDLANFKKEYKNEIEYIAESIVDFEFEMSLIIIRDTSGQIKYFDPIVNEHVNGILHISKSSDQRIDEALKQRIIDCGKQLITSMDIYGILAIEMFYGKDHEIYINEIAPRPHNSGHLTLDAYNVSQYEALIKMLTNDFDFEIKKEKEVVMVNVLGQDVEKLPRSLPDQKVYWYYKQEAKHNRKMGHINLIGIDCEELEKKARKIIERE